MADNCPGVSGLEKKCFVDCKPCDFNGQYRSCPKYRDYLSGFSQDKYAHMGRPPEKFGQTGDV